MDFKPQIKILKNGLKLIFINIPQFQSTTALLMVKTGSRWETDTQAGIAHFLEHLVAKGTKKYPSALKIATAIDSIGAEHNAFTSKEYTGFYVKSASSYLDLGLDILSQLIFQPLLREKDINKEKGVILEEMKMYNDMPMAKVGQVFESLIYSNTPLGRKIIGNKNSVLSLKKPDFISFRQKWYQPEKMVLAISGALPEKYFGKIKNKFENYPSGYAAASSLGQKPLKFKQNKPQIKIYFQKTQQAHFCLGFRAFKRAHKLRYALAVLSAILGGNMSSRLFTQVREKRGLAYYIKSNINTYFDNGYLVVQAGVDINKIGEAIKVILAEISKISLVKDKELKRAKEYLKGKLALNLEDTSSVASLMAEDLLLEGRARLIKEIIKGIEKVAIKDIQIAAKKVFDNKNLNLAIIGPYKKEDKLLRLLKL